MPTLTIRLPLRKALLLLSALLILPVAGCSTAAPAAEAEAESEAVAEQSSLPPEISVDDAYVLVENGAFLLDVRTQEEWDQFHATMATHIPLDELPDRLAEVPSDQEIVVICNSGNRSQVGRDILLDAGYQTVTSVAGGSQAWASAEYPIEAGP